MNNSIFKNENNTEFENQNGKELKKVTKKLSIRNITIISMLSAVSAVLMMFSFPVPLAPTFIKMDFSELPVVLGGCLVGPLGGACISLLKIILNLILNGTTTFGVGELSNLILSISFVVPISFIYKKGYFKNSLKINLTLSTIIATTVAIVSNLVLIFPLYAKFYGLSIDDIVAMGTATNPYVKDLASLMIASLLPFNIFKYGVISILFFIVYKFLKGFKLFNF